MKHLFRGLIASLLVGISASSIFAAEWLDNYDEALKLAKSENKKVLVNFTGSDWCGWCIKLDKETFQKPEFDTFAKENLVLLKIDFPQRKQLSDEVKKQNDALQGKYGVEGFPTLVLLDNDGKEVLRKVGYLPGGPSAFEEWVRSAK